MSGQVEVKSELEVKEEEGVAEISKEEYEKLKENREKLEELGYKIIETDKYIILETPDGEKYVYRKAFTAGEVEKVELPREGKIYRAVIEKIKIDRIYKLYEEVGFNVARMLERCKALSDIRERYRCIKRFMDIGYLIVFKIPELQMEDWEIIRYSTHPNSKLRKLAASYKRFERGQQIWVQLTDKGRFKITTPPEE